jgi:hypothetical protein
LYMMPSFTGWEWAVEWNTEDDSYRIPARKMPVFMISQEDGILKFDPFRPHMRYFTKIRWWILKPIHWQYGTRCRRSWWNFSRFFFSEEIWFSYCYIQQPSREERLFLFEPKDWPIPGDNFSAFYLKRDPRRRLSWGSYTG